MVGVGWGGVVKFGEMGEIGEGLWNISNNGPGESFIFS